MNSPTHPPVAALPGRDTPVPAGNGRRQTRPDGDLVGYGGAITVLAAILFGATVALYRPAADSLWPFALGAAAIGAGLASAGWFGLGRPGRP